MATVSASKRDLSLTSATYISTSDVTIGGNLTVDGTTVTLNTATLQIEDKNIELNKGGDATSSDGGGISVLRGDSSSATLNWENANTRFVFSNSVKVTGGINVTGGGFTTDANYLQVNTPSGYVQMGAMNTSHAHIYTDRASFYFNQKILILGNTVLTTADTQSKYLRSDTADSFSGILTGTSSGENLKIGGIRGTTKGSQSGQYIHLYERVHIGGPSGWGASTHGAPGQGLSTWGSVNFGMNGSGVLQLKGTTVLTAARLLQNVTNTNWDKAYSWGDHASENYLTSLPGHNHKIILGSTANEGSSGMQNWNSQESDLDLNPTTDWFTSLRIGHGDPVKYYSNTLGIQMTGGDLGRIYTRTVANGTKQSWLKYYHTGDFANNSGNWNTAYGWGDHGAAGYKTTDNDTIFNGGDITNPIIIANRSVDSILHYSASGNTTGAIKITLPGKHSEGWSMMVLRITLYEYNSETHTTYTVSGHDWTSGWYNKAIKKWGNGSKNIDFAYSTEADTDCLILGEVGTGWSYAHVTVDVVAHPSFYSSSMNLDSGWKIERVTNLDGITRYNCVNEKVHDSGDFTVADVTKGVTAHGYGNHASAGYLTSQDDDLPISGGILKGNLQLTDSTGSGTSHRIQFGSSVSWNNNIGIDAYWMRLGSNKNEGFKFIDSAGTMLLQVNASNSATGNGKLSATFVGTIFDEKGNSGNWNTAYGWGDHASAGYKTTDNNTTYNFVGTTFTSRNSTNPINIDSGHENLVGYTNNSTAAGFADGGLFVAAYSTSWVSQIFSNFRTGELSARGKNSGTWQAWRKIHDSGHFSIDDVKNGVTAHGWGNHASAGYLTASSTNLDSRYFTETEADARFADIATENHISGAYKDIYVKGDKDTFYPVRIQGSSTFAYHKYSVSRHYAWQAPTTWYTATHRGGLTFTFEWSGDISWGGNHKPIRVIEFGENYSTMVGGLILPVTGGVIVWLRGGDAQYRIHAPGGRNQEVYIDYDTFVSADKSEYPVRNLDQAKTGQTNEIYTKYPVRGSDKLYDSNQRVASQTWVTNTGKSADSNLLDGINSSSFLRSDTADTISSTLTMGTQFALVANNYGRGVFGTYTSTRYQHVWGMGTAYKLSDDGASAGNLYGIAYTHTNVGGESKAGLSHQALFMHNGVTHSAIGTGMWTKGLITTTSYGTSANWNTAYGWGDHAAAGYSTTDTNTQLTTAQIAAMGYIKENEDRRHKVIRFTGEGGNSDAPNVHYGISQQSGSWSHPYPDLVIAFHTGIKIGAEKGYGGTRFYSDAPGRSGAAELFSVGNGDNHVRVSNDLLVAGKLDVRGSGYNQLHISHSVSANTNKQSGITTSNYEGSNVSILQTFQQNNNNTVYYGSADASHAGLQNHRFYVNADSNTLGSGHTEALHIGSNTNATFAGTITSGNILLNGSSRALTVISSNDQVVAAFKCGNNAISTIGFQGSTGTNDYNTRIGSDGDDLVAYTANSVRMRIDKSGNTTFAGNVTTTGNLTGNTSSTTELGVYSGSGEGAIKRIRMRQGGELHFGDTTNAAPLGITEGNWNDFADQDSMSIYGRKNIKFYAGSVASTLRLTLDTNATFAGNVSASGTITATGGAIQGGDFNMNGMIFKDGSNVDRNFKMQGGTSGTDVGISVFTGAGDHSFQLYGTNNQYGFLDGNWNSWDIRKTKNGAFEVDEGSGLKRVWNAGNLTNNNQLTNGAGYKTTDNNTTYNFYGPSFTSRNSGNVINIDKAEENMVGYTNNSQEAGYADGGLFVAAYSTAWVSQIFSNFRTGELSTRGKNSGTWQAWRSIHDTGHFSVTDVKNGVTAHGWGNHASAGYSKITQANVNASTVDKANGLSEVGYGVDEGTFYQTAGEFAGYSGWANYWIGNHGDGSNYYNTVHIQPFWGSPKYSRMEGGAFKGCWSYWTEENFTPGSYSFKTSNEILSGSKSFSNSYNEFGNAYSSVSNDGNWHGRVNVAGSSHARLDVICVKDAITTTMYSHTGHGAGKVGTMTNHPIDILANGGTVAQFTTKGDLMTKAEITPHHKFSDRRLKTKIEPLENNLERVLALHPVSYQWKEGSRKGKTEIGLVAQEVEEIVPEVVRELGRLEGDGVKEYKSVDYENLVSLLIGAVKEQQEQIDELKLKMCTCHGK